MRSRALGTRLGVGFAYYFLLCVSARLYFGVAVLINGVGLISLGPVHMRPDSRDNLPQ